MGLFSGTTSTNPMTTGGKGVMGNGKNKSPYKLADTHFSAAANAATRALANKHTSALNTDKSLAKPVAGRGGLSKGKLKGC